MRERLDRRAKLGVITMEMAFKSMSLDPIPKGASTDRKEAPGLSPVLGPRGLGGVGSGRAAGAEHRRGKRREEHGQLCPVAPKGHADEA